MHTKNLMHLRPGSPRRITDIAVLGRFAAALGIAPEILGLAPGPVPGGHDLPGRSGGGELVRPYSDRGLITRQQWNGIIRDVTSELWLYGMAEFGYASDDAVPGILAHGTSRGCRSGSTMSTRPSA